MVKNFAEGGCMCGAVKVRTAADPFYVSYCHCRDCRKASGAPVMVFVGFAAGEVEFGGRKPVVYESSPGIRRSFCGGCGTPLSYEDERLEGEVYLTVGVFNEPQRFKPTVHSWDSQRLPWFPTVDGLPRHRTSSRPRPTGR